MRYYSVIIPVYNRPEEVDELLDSLTRQIYTHFEVLVVEDGSTNTCKDVVSQYEESLRISYFFKENSGQGFSRNYGFERAKGDFFVVFDSDCVIPTHYFDTVERYLDSHPLDAFGGPDRAHHSFTPIQKAISYSMTSPLTTGGIRGAKKHLGTFHPRSFNMGISREVYTKTKGYIITRMGEDIEFSVRIIKNGFSTGLIENAYVYHKRRTNFFQFYKQLHFFGRARINIRRFFPKELKLVHIFPALFTIGIAGTPILYLIYQPLGVLVASMFTIYAMLNFLLATTKNNSVTVGVLGMIASFIQLTAYGIGFISEVLIGQNKKKCNYSDVLKSN